MNLMKINKLLINSFNKLCKITLKLMMNVMNTKNNSFKKLKMKKIPNKINKILIHNNNHSKMVIFINFL